MTRLILIALLLAPAMASAQQWYLVEAQDQPITVAASGMVASADSLRFGPPPNRRWRIALTQLAQEGSRVKEGDVLARFDGSATDDRIRTLSAELNAKRSELESLEEAQAQEIEDGKVRLAAARSAAEKAARKAAGDVDLFASLEYRKLIEERDIAQAVYEREQQRIELVARVRQSKQSELEADIRRLESELTGAQRELEAFTITAPRAGLVIVGTNREGQKLDINEQVNPGMIVVELADENDLVIQAEVPEFAANRIALGQRATMTIDAAGASALEGAVIDVGAVVRRQSQYSQAMVRDVTVSLPTDIIAQLRPGMSAQLEIVVDQRRDALAVPDSALKYREGRPGVTLRDGEWKPVTLGQVAGAGMHIVEDGLEAGQEVAL
ncbi:MAG: HlyD family efflux transporter periplasmic adaptor subunit [Gammaproteobacteria bacterium]|nr:HlyD family efflux transporter periplasmic adaptor subunit [Gammaproteobacteria bacterium]NNJ77801.1 HlyD family efflux transporter periplasmic adaptor subunit [Xanthomonadales bacterium]